MSGMLVCQKCSGVWVTGDVCPFCALSASAREKALREALESILCHAAEGPEAFALEGRKLIELVQVIEREAAAALRPEETPT